MIRRLLYRTVLIAAVLLMAGSLARAQQATGPVLSFAGIGTGTAQTFIGDPTGTQPASPADYSGPVSGLVPNGPRSLAVDGAGNIYLLDIGGELVRVVASGNGPIPALPSVASPVAGTVYPLAGTGSVGASCTSGCPALQNSFHSDNAGLTVDAKGNVYVADHSGNPGHYVWVVYAAGAVPGLSNPVVGNMYAVAGNGSPGLGGDGGPATQATVGDPEGVAVDTQGNIYIVEGVEGVIRVVYAGGSVPELPSNPAPVVGNIYTLQSESYPITVSLDSSNNIYTSDLVNQVLYAIYAGGNLPGISNPVVGTQYTIAGNGSSASSTYNSVPATSVGIGGTFQTAIDANQNIYIPDVNDGYVFEVNSAGLLSTVFGTTQPVCGIATDQYGDGCSGTSATLLYPLSVAFTAQGDLLVADDGHNLVRKLQLSGATGSLNFPTTGLGVTSEVQSFTVTNSGSAALVFSGIAVSSGFSQQPSGGTDCASTETLAPRASCQIGIAFSPTQLGTTTGTLTISSNAGNANNGTNIVSLVGSSQATTGTALSASASSIGGGQSVTFTATVTPAVAGTPTGTVTFTSGATVLATQTMSGGAATLTTNTLPIGANSIVATYSGDTDFTGSTSAAIQVVVTPGVTTTSLAASTTTPTPGQSVTFTAVVTSGGPVIPTGSVNFMNGTASLGTSSLDATGTATLTTSSLPVGADSVTAVYSGDAIFAVSSSAAVGVTVGGIESPTVTVTVSNTSLTANQLVTLQVTVGPTTFATPTGTVTLMNGTTTLGTGTLNSAFTAFAAPYLRSGNNSITAVYSGDANFSGATSAPVQVVVTGTPVALLSMSPPIALTAAGDITGTLPASAPTYTGPATGLVLTSPTGVVADAFGNLYILDNGTNIWVVASGNGPIPALPSVPSPQANTVYQAAGQGAGCASQTDSAGDGCLATQANFNAYSSLGLAIDSYGNLFIVDSQNSLLRVIYANGAILGLSNPVPGSIYAVSGFDTQDSDIWVDPFENIYLADTNQVTVNYSSGQVPALGPGLTSGSIYNISSNGYLVQSIGGDPLGNISFGDDGDQVVQAVYTAGPLLGLSNPVVGQSYTVAGTGGLANGPENNVPATSAGVGAPGHLTADSAGNLYIPDYIDGFVFRVDAAGNLTTIFGAPSPGCATATDTYGDGCLGAAASLSAPYSVALDPSGDLFIADNGAHLVRELSAQTSQLTFGAQSVGTTSPVESVTISNPGAAPLTLSAITVSSQFAQAPSGGTDCSTTQSIPPGGSCQLGVVYAPTQSGSPTGTVTLTSNANGTTSTNTIMLVGTTTAANNPVPTITSLQPAGAPAGSGAFTLTVNGTNFISGSVVNFNGNAETTTFVSATQVTAAIQASDIASVGTPAVTVTNPTPGGGTSNALTFTINAANNPVPTITSLQPASATAGSGAFTLTVNGTNFISGSVVTFNGNAETTAFVSATQVTAAIQASDITSAGATAVTVTNPAPGGGTSNALTFTINAAGSASTFTVTSSTSPQTVQPGGTAQYSVTVTAQNGTFSNPVTLSASGLPPGATATFSQPTVTPGGSSASSQLSIQTTSTTAALAGGVSKWLAAATLPFFGLFFIRRRHRRRWSTLAVLLLASLGAVAALSGCGAKKNNAQSYTITITGTSGAVAESTTIQLTVQ